MLQHAIACYSNYTIESGQPELAKLLLELGADKEARGEDGATPLLLAVAGEHLCAAVLYAILCFCMLLHAFACFCMLLHASVFFLYSFCMLLYTSIL